MSDSELEEKLKAIPIGVYWPYGSTGLLTDETIDAFMQLIHARERALLAAIRAELPKPFINPVGDDEKIGFDWYNDCLDDVAAILRKYENQ